jgi:hypothetical protein
VQGELGEVDLEAGEQPNIDKAVKCIEKFGDESGMFPLQKIAGTWHSNHERAYEGCNRVR